MPKSFQIIPAHQGYFALDYCFGEHDGSLEVFKTPVIAWQIDDSDPDWVFPVPVLLDPQTITRGILCPDGSVEGGADCWPSLEAWSENKRLMLAAEAKNKVQSEGGAG